MGKRLFDLNIEEILDNWEVHHAIREIIANALDEQFLTKTNQIQIQKDSKGYWHIRDYGRGIQIEHFTLNENIEKLNVEGVIGKFGVGLKDAIATFSRHKIQVHIFSRYGKFTLREAGKHGFDKIITLHVEYDDSPINLEGTDVALYGISDEEIAKAKSMFMTFSQEEVIETTSYGQILNKRNDSPRVYINGVLAAEEPNFFFTYNITSLTEAMRKRLNRERLNVGRMTYTDRVKVILRAAKSEIVKSQLADQVSLRAEGTQCDELQWLEISTLAFNYLHERRQVAFITEQEVYNRPEIIDNIRRDGFTPVIVDHTQRDKIEKQIEAGGPQLRTVDVYVEEYNQSFQYKFVELSQLNAWERKIYSLTPHLIKLVGVSPITAPQVKISETLRMTFDRTQAVWDSGLGAIVILRKAMIDPEEYAGTLLHELTHAIMHQVDVTRDFELSLTKYLGKTAIAALKNSGVDI